MEKPRVEHLYQNHHIDSTRWKWFTPRDDDIVIATSYKAGTTFTQIIVGNLLFPDGLPSPITQISPWLDARPAPLELVLGSLEAQEHRRFIKTHLPLDGLPFYDNVKYICVSRDPRDVFMSLLNHWANYTPETIAYTNMVPGRVGDPFPQFVDDIKTTWRTWMTRNWFEWEDDGYPYWSHLRHALTYWEFRHLPNVMMLHFNDLLADLEGEMRRIADYLDIEVPPERWAEVVDRCTFEEVKKDPEKVVGNLDTGFKGGAHVLINKGTNGRWRGVLDREDLALYEHAMARLPKDYAYWVENGGSTP